MPRTLAEAQIAASRRLAASLLLPGESSEALEALAASILNRHPPTDEIELGYVNMAVAAQWRLRRVHAMEQTSLITAAAASPQTSVIQDTFPSLEAELPQYSFDFGSENKPGKPENKPDEIP